MPNLNILAFSGSLRKDSKNTGLLRAIKELAAEDIQVHIADISDLPLYNQDLEGDFPVKIAALKKQIREADGIIIATPEFNRSIPGPLKNMLDWTSRPNGDSAWPSKHVAVVGASPGSIGTAVAQYNLKQILLYLDTLVLGQPEFYVSLSKEKFDAEGNLTDLKTKEKIANLLEKFRERIGK